MTNLTAYSSYADAQKNFSSERLWELFDGNREHLNIAHECVDRHADSGRDAVIVVHADGRDELIVVLNVERKDGTGGRQRFGECAALILHPLCLIGERASCALR